MGRAGRKTKTYTLAEQRPPQTTLGPNYSPPAWNFSKKDLGGLIFFSSNETLDECFYKHLFGLPAIHFSYVKNIEPGLPLFLFNYSDRHLHGVYEAASQGQMNIDPFGWSEDGSDRTPYPAQVRFRVRQQCRPLSEKQFRQIIHKNYIDHQDRKDFFRLELDHKQTRELIYLFGRSPVTKPLATSKKPPTCKPSQQVNPNLDKLATKRASSEDVNMGNSFPSEFHHSSGSWASLFKKHPEPVSKSEAEDVKPLHSEVDWDEEDPVCEDLSNTDSVPSVWDEEKQIVGINSNKVTTENEAHFYSNLEQLTSASENSTLEKRTEDEAPCDMERATIEYEEGNDILQMTFEQVYSNLEENTKFVPCETYETTLTNQLRKELEEWKAFSMELHQKTCALEKKLTILETYTIERDRRTLALEKKLDAIEKDRVTSRSWTAACNRSQWDVTGPEEETEDW